MQKFKCKFKCKFKGKRRRTNSDEQIQMHEFGRERLDAQIQMQTLDAPESRANSDKHSEAFSDAEVQMKSIRSNKIGRGRSDAQIQMQTFRCPKFRFKFRNKFRRKSSDDRNQMQKFRRKRLDAQLHM